MSDGTTKETSLERSDIHMPALTRRSLIASAALCAAGAVRAQPAFPTKPVQIEIPFSAGTGNDTVGRVIARKLPEFLGQSVVIENKPGASGTIATEYIRHSTPDGYTLMLASVSFSILPHTTNVKYTTADFTPIAMVGALPFTLLVSKSVPAKNVTELVDLLKRDPGKYSAGLGGTTGTTYFLLQQLKKAAGVDIVAANYKGTSDAALDLSADRVQILFAPITTALMYRQSGNVKVLGVTGTKRTAIMPDVATFPEQGYPKFEVATWFGLIGPAGVPANAVNMIAQATEKTLASKDIVDLLHRQGIEPAYRPPAEFKAFLDADRGLWGNLVKEMNQKATK